MESKAHFAKRHPLHPSLIAFPVALLPLMIVMNVLYLWLGDQGFWVAGLWIGIIGVLSTIVAMIPGIIDMSAIPDEERAHKIALWHAIVGTLVLVAYAASVWLRWPAEATTGRFALVMGVDIVGSLFIVAQGWLGGELVYRHHMGVLSEAEGGEPTPLIGKGPEPGAPAGARRRGASRP